MTLERTLFTDEAGAEDEDVSSLRSETEDLRELGGSGEWELGGR